MPTINRKTNYQKQAEWKKESNSMKYYNSRGWKKLREAIMSNHPLCVECAAKGISRPATDLHHIVEFQKGITENDKWNLLLDPNNIIPLCEAHHYAKHHKSLP